MTGLAKDHCRHNPSLSLFGKKEIFFPPSLLLPLTVSSVAQLLGSLSYVGTHVLLQLDYSYCRLQEGGTTLCTNVEI